MSRRRVSWSIASALVLVAVAAAVALAQGDEQPAVTPRPPAQVTTTTEQAAPPEPEPDRVLVLVRRRGGLPASWERRLRRSGAVDAIAEVSRTQWLLHRSATSAGRVVDAPRRGYAFPLDTFVIDPRAYAQVTGDAAFRALRGGRVLLSDASARLRHLRTGDRMTLTGGRTVAVGGVVPDDVARGAELVAATADVPRGQRRATALVVATRDPDAVADAVPDDRLTRVGRLDARPDSATTAGSITRPVQLKHNFGEFAVKLPYGANWIDIDPGWVRRNIVTRSVPILGAVTCHRAMIAPLRRALGRLHRQGLARLVDRGDYAGCFAARRIADSGSLSLHAWGLAVDMNASENPQGSTPRQDRRVVRAFERVGFTWGGRWPTAPDGMHFEWHGD
jgi:hypothetical protein